MSISVRRPIYNPHLLVPGVDVAITIPSIKTVLAESEYQLITSMAGDNFSEPLKVSSHTAGLHMLGDSAVHHEHAYNQAHRGAV